MQYILHTPLTKADLAPLKAGDTVLLSGVVYTARDADAHGQRQRTEDQPYDEPSAAGHAWCSRLAR